MPRKEEPDVSSTPAKKSQRFLRLLNQLNPGQIETLLVLINEMVESNRACIRSVHAAL